MTDQTPDQGAVKPLDLVAHYTLVELDGRSVHHSFEVAEALSGGNDRRIWVIRDMDLVLDKPDAEGTIPWVVEPWAGQSVHVWGYFVTTDPRRPEHDDLKFTYRGRRR